MNFNGSPSLQSSWAIPSPKGRSYPAISATFNAAGASPGDPRVESRRLVREQGLNIFQLKLLTCNRLVSIISWVMTSHEFSVRETHEYYKHTHIPRYKSKLHGKENAICPYKALACFSWTWAAFGTWFSLSLSLPSSWHETGPWILSYL